jgi:ribosomal peptide maturation radical SAM protein 1
VALVVMPFGGADGPNLAAGLLKALLLERGIACDCKYLNLTLCRLAGQERYRQMVKLSKASALAGEWIFSQIYFGGSVSSWESYRREVLDHPLWGIAEEHHGLIQELSAIAPTFLRIAYECCDWAEYDLVGFTSTFEQTMPSLCLARMIRRHHPGIKIAIGGANFEGPMGRPYLDLFPELDFVSTGEADLSFPRLCENLARGDASVPAGLLSRSAEPPRGAEAAIGPAALDALPFPDYDDFFAAFARTFPGEHSLGLPPQAARGCWWGQKHHCTFCGLNGETMAFRRKSWERVAEETAEMEARYRPASIFFADNILAMDYFPTLLPHWAAAGGPPKFFEIKANLRREQVVALERAQVLFIQSGIESLSDRTLRLMDKGISAAQNIALLRWCREVGVSAHWNLIFGFPGEDLEDYPRMHELMQKLAHLNAPEACAPIRMDRFSPNFERWREKGFLEVRPQPCYRHVYPLAEDRLRELAYHFEYRHAHSDQVLELAGEIITFGALWRQRCETASNGTLAVRRHLDGGWVLVDTRFNRAQTARRLNPEDLLLLRLCDSPIAMDTLLDKAASLSGRTRKAMVRACAALVRQEGICEAGERVVALPLLPAELRETPFFTKGEAL